MRHRDSSPRRALAASLCAAAFAAAALAPRPGRAAEPSPAPYLQALGPRAVTIKLGALEQALASVDVTGPNGFSKHAEAAKNGSFQVIRVEGLEPSTSYEYRVRAGDVASPAGHFTTAPADDRPFRFILYGDNRSNAAVHAATVRAMLATPADFLIHTGDMVADGSNQREWREFFTIEAELLRDRCVFASVGNHELTTPDPTGELAFLRYFAGSTEAGADEKRLYATMRWSNTRFFFLNAMDEWTSVERRWLDETLTRADAEEGLVHRIAVLHWSPFSSGRHGGNPELAAGKIVPLMRAHGVDLLFAGHDHIYERGEGGGLKYIISGGAGAPLYSRGRPDPATITFESVHHFVEVAIDGDRVDTVARTPSGSVVEACGFRGNGGWECASSPKKAASAPPVPAPAPARAATAVEPSGACSCGVPAPGSSPALALLLALAPAAAVGRRRRRPPIA